MTDRELLELAAKAAGIEHPSGEHCINGPALWDCKALQWWKPLTDDGDALRLAVILGLDQTLPHLLQGEAYRTDRFALGAFAATRRAIVRAAAEIGKTRSD